MNGGLTLLLRMRIWALLLLAAIGMQAAEPIRAPLVRTPGSAWSSATSDLALASTRRGEDSAQEASPQPPLRLDNLGTPDQTGIELAMAAQRPMAPVAQGPPLSAHPALPPDSTAPPFA